jgi:conjugal transfer ATP-binding protein TraC
MESTALLNQLLARNSLSDYLPHQAYNKDADCYILETGVGLIFECSPLQFPSENHKEMLRSLFETSLAPGTSIQFLLYASKYVEAYLDSYVLSRKNVTGESFYSASAQQRKDLYLKGADENIMRGTNVKVRNFKLYVSMVIPCDNTPEGYSKCLTESVPRYRETMRQVLNTMNMAPTPMPPEKFTNLLMEILNPGHVVEENSYDTTVEIREQVVYSDTEVFVEPDYLKIDKRFCQSMTVKQYPEEWDVTKSMNFCGSIYENAKQIGVPFLLVMNCEYPDQIKDNASVQKRALTAKYQSFGNFSKWFPGLVMRKKNYDILLESLENESLFFGYFNLFFFARSKQEMYDVNQSFKSLYRSMGVVLQDDPFISLPLFLQMLPMGYNAAIQRDVKRRNTRTTGTIAELVPIYADWGGCGRPAIQLVSRRGQLQYFDVFSNTKGGYSAVVVASTGAGKSFFVNDLTIGYLGLGTKIWTIDIGRSYEKLCETVGGQFVEFSPDSDICLNPFTQVADLPEEMPMLKSIIAQMASREPLDDLNMAFIEEAIRDVFQKQGNDTTAAAIAEYLGSKRDSRQKELSMRLYPYSRNGAYGKLFNGKSNLVEEGDYLVYELEELKSKKDLQEVILLALVYQIQQDMLKKDRQKLILIDEAWEMLRGGNTTTFIETGYRRFRKMGGACIAITQSVNDFYKLPAGVAIVENSDYFFLLRQRPESIEALKKSGRLSLSEGLYDLLRSVHTDSGNYSEILCYTPDGITIGRLIVDRFTQLVYTSRADEFTKIKQYQNNGMNLADAINAVIRDESRN